MAGNVTIYPGQAIVDEDFLRQALDKLADQRATLKTLMDVVAEEQPQAFKPPLLDPPTAVRTFSSGATRDTDQGKFDYEAFLSPLVLERYARYMHFNRHQSDGMLRDGDNWQRGIPIEAYQKSLWRHMMAAWTRWRGWDQTNLQEHLCGVLFNAMGLLHELVKAEQPKQQAATNGEK